MNDYISISTDDILSENLAETAERLGILCEQEIAHLYEMALEIADGAPPTSELIASLPDHKPPVGRASLSALAQSAPMLAQFHGMHAVWRSVQLCMHLRSIWGLDRFPSQELFFPDTEPLPSFLRARILYQRSSYADEAFLRFGATLPMAPRAVYTNKFTTVCEEVLHGGCDFGILPLENSADGPLHSFSRLIEGYGLRIVATCDIPTTDGTRSTRFALLHRQVLLPSSTEGSICFELSVPLEADGISAEALLNAASLCGLRTARLGSRLLHAEEDAPLCAHPVFEVGQGDLTAFLLYLAMEAPQYEPIGVYSHIPQNNQQKG